MQLISIGDMRIGQIYKNKDNNLYLITKKTLTLPREQDAFGFEFFIDGINQGYHGTCFAKETIKEMEVLGYELAGFLNITHKIEGDRLVKIPREEFEVDDVVENNEGYFQVIDRIYQDDSRHLLGDDLEFTEPLECLTKVGILGVNYEFINDKLAKEKK